MRPTHQCRIVDGPSAFRLPPSALRRGFTLVELLVVITIIGILASLLLAAASGAFGSARQTAIAVEMSTVSQTIETYRNEVSGGAYPPDIGVGPTAATTLVLMPAPAAVRNAIAADFKRHFNRAFPRHREPDELFDALTGVAAVAGDPNAGGLNPAEALVFWLQRFSSDPQYPVSGSGGPSYVVAAEMPSLDPTEVEDITSRNWIGNFEPTRYGMLVNGARQSIAQVKESITTDADVPRHVRYMVDSDNDGSDETRQINLWQYFPPNSPQPLAYFDASRGVRDINHADSLGAEVHPLKQLKASTTARTYGNLELVNAGKFQVLHSGLDEDWGSFAPVRVVGTEAATATLPNEFLLYPNGPFTLELADTLVSFSDKATLEDNQP